MSNICIIPARGGSKRIPRKNIKEFLGKPIIAYSIEAALESKLFDIVMVSTDDDEIANIAIEYGAEVPFLRSKNTSNDFSTTFEVIEEVLQNYKSKSNQTFDHVCCIYACAPFVTSKRLVEGLNLLKEKDFGTVFPVLEYSCPIQRALKINTNSTVSFVNKEYALVRTQDLEKNFHDTGQYYWLSSKTISQEKKIIGNNAGCLILSELEAQDIDTFEDWKLAEFKFSYFNAEKSLHKS